MAAVSNQRKPITVEEPIPTPKEKKTVFSKRNWLYESLDFSRFVHHKTIIRTLPFVFFISFLGMLYIGNAHYSEKNILQLNKMETDMNELRWNYMTSQSELEFVSKKSEVAKVAARSGLKELNKQPAKIVLP
ncbi:MAG: hypothetical protein H0W62_06015 [Chitinophagales bacterium]|nr:hypothetical protein [Chitinophagales bacterium]